MTRVSIRGLLIGAVPSEHVTAYAAFTQPIEPHPIRVKLEETDSRAGGFFTMQFDWEDKLKEINPNDVENAFKVVLESAQGRNIKDQDVALDNLPQSLDFGHIEFLRQAPDDKRQWVNVFWSTEQGNSRFKNLHNLHFNLANNDEVWSVSGVVDCRLKGSGPALKTFHLVLEVPLNEDWVSGNKYFKVNQWLTSITPAKFSNVAHAVNAGWGVDLYGGPYAVEVWPYPTPTMPNPSPTMVLQADIQVSDIDGYVDSIAYQSTIIGKKYTLTP